MAEAQRQQGDQGPVLTTSQARQGLRGRHVLWILVISMGLVAIGYAVLVLGMQGRHGSSPGGQTTIDQKTLNQTGFTAPPSQPRQSENPQTTPTITPAR
jgi:hypothetical protein